MNMLEDKKAVYYTLGCKLNFADRKQQSHKENQFSHIVRISMLQLLENGLRDNGPSRFPFYIFSGIFPLIYR